MYSACWCRTRQPRASSRESGSASWCGWVSPPPAVPCGKAGARGGDDATTSAFSTDVSFGGVHLPAGKYSVWVVPMERGPWTFVLSTAAEVFHTPYPRGKDALRIPVTPQRGPHMETLAFYFPLVDGDSAVLSLHWGTTVLSIPIKAGSAPR